jgi:Holliday junction resolvase
MTRYEGGRAFEYETRRHLEANGYWCARAAGSKGKADLIAIKDGEVLIVQCKRDGRCSAAERLEVHRIAALLRGVGIPLIAARPGVTFRRITGPGPKDWTPWTVDFTGASTGALASTADSQTVKG